ncbi:MAG: FecR family protein [Chitinophagaceae bacterium]
MERDQFWHIVAKVKSGEASPEEQLELNQHLAKNHADIELLKMMDAFWEVPFRAKAGSLKDETKQAWNKFQKRIVPEAVPMNPAPANSLRRIAKFQVKTAAVFLIVAGGFWLWNASRSPGPLQKNTVSTRNGSKSKVDMPDGTQIWLNVGSRIEYDENYGKKNREITLTGEAYFDVVHNEKKPFIIHTQKMNVKVLGTVFNVKAYPGDKMTEVELIKGRIEVTFPGRPQEKLILKPSDKIAVVNSFIQRSPDIAEAKKITKKIKPEIVLTALNYQATDSTIIETAWVKNKFIFRSKKFDELSRDMERWSGVSILVRDSAMLEEEFTGTFNNESITGALDALKLSYPFQYRYEKNNNTMTIYKK